MANVGYMNHVLFKTPCLFRVYKIGDLLAQKCKHCCLDSSMVWGTKRTLSLMTLIRALKLFLLVLSSFKVCTVHFKCGKFWIHFPLFLWMHLFTIWYSKHKKLSCIDAFFYIGFFWYLFLMIKNHVPCTLRKQV